MGNAKLSFWDGVQQNMEYGFNAYRDLLFGFIIGITFAWLYHRFIGSKNLRDSHKILIKAKDEVIAAYRALVSERLESITVE
jgi:uncharacterized membrane protein (DUF106 family)